MLDRQRRLRRDSTEAERTLWRILRSRHLEGFKFRRQHAFGRYILDFFCADAMLAVEVDGGQHCTPAGLASDEERTAELSAAGVRVLRVTNTDVLTNAEGVADAILAALRA